MNKFAQQKEGKVFVAAFRAARQQQSRIVSAPKP